MRSASPGVERRAAEEAAGQKKSRRNGGRARNCSGVAASALNEVRKDAGMTPLQRMALDKLKVWVRWIDNPRCGLDSGVDRALHEVGRLLISAEDQPGYWTMEPTATTDGPRWYVYSPQVLGKTVKCGPFVTRGEAEKALRALKNYC